MKIGIGIGTAIGFAQSLSRSARLRDDVQEKLLAAAERVADKVRDAVPVDEGALRDSVRVVPGRSKPSVAIIAGGPSTTDEGGYDHALSTEFGTQRQAARPFFYPTIRENLDLIEDAVPNAITDPTEN